MKPVFESMRIGNRAQDQQITRDLPGVALLILVALVLASCASSSVTAKKNVPIEEDAASIEHWQTLAPVCGCIDKFFRGHGRLPKDYAEIRPCAVSAREHAPGASDSYRWEIRDRTSLADAEAVVIRTSRDGDDQSFAFTIDLRPPDKRWEILYDASDSLLNSSRNYAAAMAEEVWSIHDSSGRWLSSVAQLNSDNEDKSYTRSRAKNYSLQLDPKSAYPISVLDRRSGVIYAFPADGPKSDKPVLEKQVTKLRPKPKRNGGR